MPGTSPGSNTTEPPAARSVSTVASTSDTANVTYQTTGCGSSPSGTSPATGRPSRDAIV